ncbi:MAG: hypothetical protein JXB32_09395 [Deltaproteobacteria bacterium]|nr:hypothetical protein [Deltaproteobacteria bacterium]
MSRGRATDPASVEPRFRLPTWAIDLLCAAALLGLATFHLRGAFAGGFPVSEDYDTLILQYPMHRALGEALADGELPWWVSEAGHGLPLVAEGEAGVLFPPNLVLFGLLPPYEAYVLALLLALAALGIGTYGLTRSLGAGPPGALLAGSALMLSGFALGHEHHLSLLRTAALLPWLLWVAEAHVRRPRWVTVGLGALVVALQWLAGNPQLAHLSAVTLAAYLPTRAWMEASGAPRARLRAAGWGLAAAGGMVLVGLLVAAVQVLPSYLYAAETIRANGLSWTDATVLGYPPRDLLMFLDPAAFGTPMDDGFQSAPGERCVFWENVAYVGLLPLLLAPYAFVARELRRRAALLGSLALLALLIALGRHTPVFRVLFEVLPGFDRFRVPQRWLLVAALAIVTLGALALTAGARRVAERWSARNATLLAFALAGLAAYDVGRFGDGYYPTLPRDEVESPSPTATQLGAGPLLAVPVHGPHVARPGGPRAGDWFGRDALALVSHSLNVAWDIRSPLMYVGLPTRRSQHFEDRTVNTLARTMDSDGVSRPGSAWATATAANGVAWITSFVPIETPGLEEAFRADVVGYRVPVHVYRNRFVRPRATVVGRAHAVQDETQALDLLLADPGIDPGGETIVEAPRGGIPEDDAVGAAGTARVVAEHRGRLELEVLAERDGWLVTTDAPLSGWSVAVDGKPDDLLPADVLCRAVRVPAGTHRVVFEYDPPGRTAGWLASGVGLLLLAGLFVLGFLRREHRPTKPAAEQTDTRPKKRGFSARRSRSRPG